LVIGGIHHLLNLSTSFSKKKKGTPQAGAGRASQNALAFSTKAASHSRLHKELRKQLAKHELARKASLEASLI